MASLPALVAALAMDDDRDPGTLRWVARTIQEAGYITTTRRGRGSAAMTVRDAANLLIAANGADSPAGGPEAIRQYRSLEQPLARRRQDEDRHSLFAALDGASHFGVAVETLIERMPELDAMLARVSPESLQMAEADPARQISEVLEVLDGAYRLAGMDIVFHHTAIPAASIQYWVASRASRHVEREWHFVAPTDLVIEGYYPRRRAGRHVTVTIASSILRSLHAALYGANPDAAGHGEERREAPRPADGLPAPTDRRDGGRSLRRST